MSEMLWTEVDRYLETTLIGEDLLMRSVLAANADAGLPAIDVSPVQGRFLELLVRITGARRILEIGTLGGYSTIWMARALPEDGRLVTLEFSPKHAEAAAANIERAGVAGKVDLRIGPALESLPGIEQEGLGPFDLIFIDADKPSNADYVGWAVKLSRPGTVVVLDNVVREGTVTESGSRDASVAGARRGLELMGNHPQLTSTALQTVGVKGYDGFAIAVVS